MPTLEEIIMTPQESFTKISSEELTILGRVASKRMLEDGVPMNDTISKIASERKLNDEQTKRVIETANKSAFLAKFREGSFDKNISFDVADPAVILNKDSEKTAAPYREIPRAAGDFKYENNLFDYNELFPVVDLDREEEKVASPEGMDFFEVAGRYKHLRYDKEMADSEAQDSMYKFAEEARQAMLNGNAPILVKKLASAAMRAAGFDKADELAGFFLDKHITASMKLAGEEPFTEPNVDHPVYQTAEKLARDYAKSLSLGNEMKKLIDSYGGSDKQQLMELVDA